MIPKEATPDGFSPDHAVPIYKNSHPLSIAFTISKYPSDTLGQFTRRLEKGLSQRELAEEIGVNEMTVVGWEKNLRKPRGRNIQKLRVFFQEQEMTILERLFKTER